MCRFFRFAGLTDAGGSTTGCSERRTFEPLSIVVRPGYRDRLAQVEISIPLLVKLGVLECL